MTQEQTPLELAARVLELDKDATPGKWWWRVDVVDRTPWPGDALIADDGTEIIFLDSGSFEYESGKRDKEAIDAKLIAEYRIAAPVLARALIDLRVKYDAVMETYGDKTEEAYNKIDKQQEERKKWGKQVRLWQKLYYPLYGTLRAAQDIVDTPDQFEDWLKRFIDEAVKLMEAAGSGGPDFAALDTGDAELFNLLSEQNRFMNEEMLKQHAEIERLRAAIKRLNRCHDCGKQLDSPFCEACQAYNIGLEFDVLEQGQEGGEG